MCSIGWVKLEDSWLLFKNRDRRADEPKQNYFFQDEEVFGFGDKRFEGFWFGANYKGLGIAAAYGPVNNELKDPMSECFWLVEKTLRKHSKAEEAVKFFVEEGKHLKKSFNLIIADREKAVELELFNGNYSIEIHEDKVFKTNHFTMMDKLNLDGNQKRVEISKARLKRFVKLAKCIKCVEDVKTVLSYHSENELESMCRHSKTQTIASAIFKFKDSGIEGWYVLDDFPHNNRWHFWETPKNI